MSCASQQWTSLPTSLFSWSYNHLLRSLVIFMDNSQISAKYSKKKDGLQKLIICSWVIIKVEDPCKLRQCSFCLHSKLSILRISSYWEATTNVLVLRTYTGLTRPCLNGKERTDLPLPAPTRKIAAFSKSSWAYSTSFQLQDWLMTKSYVCTVAWAKNWAITAISRWSRDQLIFQIKDYFAICYGLIQKRTKRKIGSKVSVESVIHSTKTLFKTS